MVLDNFTPYGKSNSMELNIVKEILILTAAVLGTLIAFWVLLSNPKEKINRIFFLLTFFSVVWIVFSFLGTINKNVEIALFFKRLNFAALMPFFATAYLFSMNFPKKQSGKIVKVLFGNIVISVTAFIFFSISIFTDLVIKKVEPQDWGNNIIGGSGYTMFNIIVLIFTILIFINLYKKYFSLDENNRSKVQYFIVGASIFAVFNIIFNMALPLLDKSYRYDSFGDFSIIFFLIFTAYAIVKHQLFNIKVITTETTVIALSVGLLVEVFLSNSLNEGLLKSLVWVLATYGGYVLVKSVQVEIKQKEELANLANALESANTKLQELDETKDNFLSMASHELNTPIAAIEGYLSMIIEEEMAGKLNPKLKSYLSNVFNSSKRLAALVRDLLNVSRIESNRIHIIYSQVQIEDIIKQAIAEVKIKADEVGHKLTFKEPSRKLPKTWLDAARITEVVINLLGNAIKYTDPGGKIEVEAHSDDNKIIVSVTDNGRGIPKDRSDHIFEKFSQVDVLKDQVKGTGLGMFISKNLVELHKGKIWFKSSVDTDDHGTTFYFSLPIIKEKPFDKFEGQGAVLKLK